MFVMSGYNRLRHDSLG